MEGRKAIRGSADECLVQSADRSLDAEYGSSEKVSHIPLLLVIIPLLIRAQTYFAVTLLR